MPPSVQARISSAHLHGVYGLKSEWKRRYNAMMTRGERVIAVFPFRRTAYP